ncbi:branched-chain amino acid ABC transporter permease [Paracoccus sp. R12_1]|uniref:branched-chain amino acid ABC transporter permease n=1 Tax=unclassified Paracoccus (in: a-proteobacteria) TaxID=2688777 RepID=UPI000C0B260F|nr:MULTISPECIES: branched-chain amino acid ABC transporter permease [unclassified Paracoccus (in: a-proteobacteria)]MBO9455888.1 branched-chain amino acid ABC transporter permease [Paracoccus sp. R12_2]MBO9486696.1 branched-chain amino acid ABC transporter permease [Paracoccus sp. R12_1]PHQ68556.1 MAG: branched-chain amino acid ABC transporter permease [Paracoccus sp. (in: a-proteobacteria)]
MRLIPTRAWAATILFTAFAVLPFLAVALDDSYLVVIASRILCYAIAALALDLILGYGGMVSFGHAAYLGIGAYAVAILSRAGITDLGLHMLAAIAAAAVFALVTGAISLRTRGIYFIMITLAFAQMAYFFFVSLSAYGGDDGVTLNARSTLFGQTILEDDTALYYAVLVLLIGLYLLAVAITRSRFGRVLTGARENPVRMQAIGFSPFRYQLTAFVISGCMTAIAGVMLANQTSYVSPAFMNWHRSGELVVMVVFGGIGNLLGAVAGATIALLLEEWLAVLTKHWPLLFGLILVLVVLYSRDGLSGLFRRRR